MFVGRLILGALSLFLVFGTGSASDCTTWSTSHPEVDTTDANPLGRTYVDNDLCQPECLFSVWIYFEANGIPGLQRGDEVVDNTCHGMIESDVIPCQLLPIALLSPHRNGKDGKASAAAVAGFAMLGATAFLPTAEAC